MPEKLDGSRNVSEAEANLQSMAVANMYKTSWPEITRERLQEYQTEIHGIMQEVEREGDIKKVGLKIARLGYKLARIPAFALAIADTACFVWAAGMMGDLENISHESHGTLGFITPGLKAMDGAISDALNDPQRRYEETLADHMTTYGERLQEENRTLLTREVAEGLHS